MVPARLCQPQHPNHRNRTGLRALSGLCALCRCSTEPDRLKSSVDTTLWWMIKGDQSTGLLDFSGNGGGSDQSPWRTDENRRRCLTGPGIQRMSSRIDNALSAMHFWATRPVGFLLVWITMTVAVVICVAWATATGGAKNSWGN
jgi:hypothetical protein